VVFICTPTQTGFHFLSCVCENLHSFIHWEDGIQVFTCPPEILALT